MNKKKFMLRLYNELEICDEITKDLITKNNFHLLQKSEKIAHMIFCPKSNRKYEFATMI